MKNIVKIALLASAITLTACSHSTNLTNQGPSRHLQCKNIKHQLLFINNDHTKMDNYRLKQKQRMLRNEYAKMHCDGIIPRDPAYKKGE